MLLSNCVILIKSFGDKLCVESVVTNNDAPCTIIDALITTADNFVCL